MLRSLVPALLILLTPGPAAGAAAADDPPKAPSGSKAVADEAGSNAAETAASEAPSNEKKAVKRKAARKRQRRCRAYAPPQYKQMVRNWQKVPRIPKPRYRAGYRDLTIYSVNLGERIRVFPYLPDGTLDPEAVAEIERVFRDKDSDAIHEVDERLIKLIYKLADHFDARQVTLISGFREPEQPEGEGAHGKGRAADLMIPGVRLPALAKVARRLGQVGVGYYPVSGFIHLDVREGRSYFWSDRSGPGQPGCPQQIMKSFGPRFDRRWSPEDDEPEPHRNRKGELLGAVEDPAADGAEPAKNQD